MTELHILNGDQALTLWKKCDFSAPYLVWKETYLEGPLPRTDDLNIFMKARAEYLATFAELSDISEEKLCRHLQNMDETILNLPQDSTVILWFDACIFDQTILMRILWLLQQKGENLPRIYLYNSSSNILLMDDFKRGTQIMQQLSKQTIKAAAGAWNAYQRQEASAMKELATHSDLSQLPHMQKALLRCMEEVPDTEGLSRTQRQILQIISSGKHSFEEIFAGQKAYEEHPFLGDTACVRILNNLIKQGRLKFEQNRYYMLTEEKQPNQQ